MRSISLFFLGTILFLSGCPSAFYAKTQMNPQSPGEIAGIKNRATVKIERDNSVWGGAIPLVIYDGEKEIGRLGPAGAFEWTREAGFLYLRISETTGKVGAIAGQGHPNTVYFTDYQQPGDTHYLQCGIKVDDDVTIWITPQQDVASQEAIPGGLGTSIVRGTIHDDWRTDKLTIFRDVGIGFRMGDNNANDYTITPEQKDNITSMNVVDGAFAFQNLPEGKYILEGLLTHKNPLTRLEIIANYVPGSVMATDRLEGAITIRGIGGEEFRRDAEGNWYGSRLGQWSGGPGHGETGLHPAVAIKETLFISNNQQREIILSPALAKQMRLLTGT